MSNPKNTLFAKFLLISKHAFIYIFLFVLVAQAVDYWRGRKIPKQNFPSAIYQTIDGTKIDLSESKEKGVTVLYFWATWCGPCKLTSPSVNKLAEDFNVVSIAMASGSDEVLQGYIQEADLNFPVVNDNSRAISNSWNVRATPFIVMIKDNEVVEYTSGVSTYPGLWLRARWAALSF